MPGPRPAALGLIALALAGCDGRGPRPADGVPCDTPAGVVGLETRDGLALEADWLPAGCGAPAALLLHMIPPANDRSNWPAAFRQDLVDAGVSVLALDRRGAGGSAGDPEDAYEGPNGRYDALAAARWLADEGAGDLVILGASNGTATMIDYAVLAREEGDPAPVALGFLTGGAYTEAQTPMSRVPAVPALFAYSSAEAAWSEAQRPLDPGTWVWREYPAGDHGTRMFDAVPTFGADLVGFVAETVGAAGDSP